MKEILGQLWRGVLDVLFPAFCLGCKSEGGFLCAACQKTIYLLEEQVCPWCYQPREFGFGCDSCRGGERFLDGVLVASRFEEKSLLQRAIHQLKYDFVAELAGPLGEILSELAVGLVEADSEEKFVLCPLPLHPRRENWRGFNQAELLCRAVMAAAGATEPAAKMRQSDSSGQREWRRPQNIKPPNLEIRRLLKRVRFEKPQMELSQKERIANVKEAFALVNAQACGGERADKCSGDEARMGDAQLPFDSTILLVDDVATTLSTLNNAAKPLKKAGYKRVFGLVLARVF